MELEYRKRRHDRVDGRNDITVYGVRERNSFRTRRNPHTQCFMRGKRKLPNSRPVTKQVNSSLKNFIVGLPTYPLIDFNIICVHLCRDSKPPKQTRNLRSEDVKQHWRQNAALGHATINFLAVGVAPPNSDLEGPAPEKIGDPINKNRMKFQSFQFMD